MNAEQTGQRVQQVLDGLAEAGQAEAGEELVRLLMEFYGAGLVRVARLLPAEALGDELVAGLLVLHDLHPEDVTARIARALGSVPDSVEVAGFDPATGMLRLRGAAGGGCGCGGEATQRRVEEALACFAPEVTSVRMEREPALLQIGTRPQLPVEVR